MEGKIEITKAILKVMRDVDNVEKNLTVGNSYSNYKGVGAKDVMLKIGCSMASNGLVLMTTEIIPTIKISEWMDGNKRKQSIFTEVKCTYLLIHESGESQVIQSYGHGVDSQDKSAGKATTYALKNAMINTFLVPTGHVDDTDKTHSNSIPTPQIDIESIKKQISNCLDVGGLTSLKKANPLAFSIESIQAFSKEHYNSIKPKQ